VRKVVAIVAAGVFSLVAASGLLVWRSYRALAEISMGPFEPDPLEEPGGGW
jgi:hypothetical protein